MKKPDRRPVFALSLLLVAVATLALASRVYFVCCYFQGYKVGGLVEGLVPPELGGVSNFNSTLLRMASYHSWDAKLGHNIKEILRGVIGFKTWFRAFNIWRRFTNFPGVELQDPTSSGCTVLSPTINNPKFNRFCFDVRWNLDEWMRKMRFDDNIMLDLVKLVKRPLDAHIRGGAGLGSERKYESCAVVGNSGILSEKEYGELIDGHELVIRLNNAMIGGFQRSVGSKTGISFVNSHIMHLCTIKSESCECHPYGNDVPIVMYICHPYHLLDYTACNSTYKSPVLITDPSFDVLCARIVKYYSLKRFAEENPGRNLMEWDGVHHEPFFHYSSGMQAVMLAVGICDRVSLFGFGKSNTSRHHYHTNQTKELSLHDFAAEQDLFRDLVERPRSIPFVSEKFEFPRVTIYR
ncbi:hypothetical protein MLD38_011697 [Melastoma candidum]|uniref:Uncharacterized protein n=1 Tax=Melastoma candidum TaxID=119954 RepID=A0ACB9R3X5_9MYRT|nr:hypothetical protein MLD38_011697 [Melastoma candidum]